MASIRHLFYRITLFIILLYGEEGNGMYAYVLIALAAVLWGLIAIFVKGLASYGFTPMEIVTIRVTITVLILFIYGFIRYPNQMKIRLKDVHLFIGTGIISIVFFNWCYFTTINEMNVSLAVILLYTSPAFITILSFIFLKEPLPPAKIFAVIGTMIGCILIAGFSKGVVDDISLLGILVGLGAGLGYALYSIFGKFALRKYDSFTVTLYTFLISSLFLFPITKLWEKANMFLETVVLLHAFGLALFPTVIAFILYTKGLEKIESSKAGVIATVEPVVATMLGVFLFDEILTFYQVIGTLFILSAVILVNAGQKKRVPSM